MKPHPYIRKHVPGKHPVAEHILIAEKALGRPLPKSAQVHHVNEVKKDNRPSNLVICPDSSYHHLLHTRTKALDACGNANWRKCTFCKQYDDPVNLTVTTRKSGKSYTSLSYHKDCNTKAHRQYLERSAA